MKTHSIFVRSALMILTGLFVTALAQAGSKPVTSAFTEDVNFSNWRNKPHEPFSDGAKTFNQVKKMLLERYYDQKLTEEDLYRAAVQGMLTHIDPDKSAWNKLLTPSEAKELLEDASGKVVGIGIEIGFDDDDGLISILDVINDSPAQLAGLKSGEKILKIDGKSFHGRQFRDVVYAMRGTPGTSVNISVLDGDQVRKVTIKRAPLTWETVAAEILPGEIGLLTIRYFTQQTPAHLKKALTKLSTQSNHGLIVDLRGNEGGLLDAAIESLDQLVPKGSIIVKTVKRGGQREETVAKNGTNFPRIPLVVLTNGSTKSSAEMAAAALQQNNNATVMGQKTFGKWSIQQLEELPNKYAIKFTWATFLSPNGQDFSGIGLPPDIAVDGDNGVVEVEKFRHEANLKTRIEKDAQLRAAVNFLKRKS